MDIDQRLAEIAESYEARGYAVVVHPKRKDLPDFAKSFKVEIVARRDDGSALVSARKSPSELESDPHVARYAEITEKQPGWRFDIVVLGPDERVKMPDKGEANEPSEADIRHALADVERMLRAKLNQQALVAAWGALEAAMRKRLRAEGEEVDGETSPRTMLNELLSTGVLSNSVFRDLEGLFQARSAIVHGFTTVPIERSAVTFLLENARKLLDESQTVQKTV